MSRKRLVENKNRVVMSISISSDLHEKLTTLAAQMHCSKSALVCSMVDLLITKIEYTGGVINAQTERN